jgi:hypothetical protein
MRSRSVDRAAGLVAVGVLALGCAGQPGPGGAAAERPRRVVLAPVSFNQDVPELLEPGIPALQAEIARHLAGKGCEVSAPPFEEFSDLWTSKAASVGGLYAAGGAFVPERYDEVVRGLLAALREDGRALDALVLPYLAVRDALIGRMTARWDGVERKVRLVWPSRSVKARFPQGASFAVSGTVKSTSLHVMIYGAGGEKLVDHYGGLELITEFMVTTGFDDSSRVPNYLMWSWGYEPRDRADLFQDPEVLRQGVRIAFAPYFQK